MEEREFAKDAQRTKAWVVQPGDTAWEISERFGLTVEQLTRVNKVIPDVLYPGDVLLVPEDAVERPVGWTFQAAKARIKGIAAHANAKFFDVFPPPKDIDEYRHNYRVLLNGLRDVETSFIMPAPTGDGGMSIGPLQISTAYHTDAWWQASHTSKYECCEDVDYAERTVINYWLRWCPWALEFGDLETLARTHNGGPQFWQFLSTSRYWRKVRIAMKKWGHSQGFPEFQNVRPRNEMLPLFNAHIPFPFPLFESAVTSAAVGTGTGALLAATATAIDMVEAHCVQSADGSG
ncbi:hypothetical protein MPTK1_6g09090 [Marchantia polymorpha subsp. ruderalis]|uniref:lysozyme n=2 Tax=Marchantia polymorpha TaxID=3197 RepID=A0AAF6BQ45_MARPO|nr:hypothetical protein MARPO_0060s0010 [Marchantia polymorpha]BBN14129.1 hypothetical protein Mp_6g09090 [Marchantia polymorpha subsp. ruderalis]|eukprot:PTQ36914.1 hypothetical protein MARPO_0060s0010 [Marchantia polymorpha]